MIIFCGIRMRGSLLRCKQLIRSMSSLGGQDIQNITTLIHEFLWCIDNCESQRFASLFADNGECTIVKSNLSVIGKCSLEKMCSDLHHRFKNTLHCESNVMIQGNGITATNTSYWYALYGGDIISTGKHVDKFIRETSTNSWKFESRIIYHHWTKNDGFQQPL